MIHPDYDPDTVNNDVALLKLPRVSSMVDLQARVVCLPRPWQALPTRQLCTILGWGKRGNGDSSGTDILQEAQVRGLWIGTQVPSNHVFTIKLSRTKDCWRAIWNSTLVYFGETKFSVLYFPFLIIPSAGNLSKKGKPRFGLPRIAA